MSSDSFARRRQALEDSFFDKKNQELLAKLQQQVKSEESRAALSNASGISNPVILDQLVSLEISPEAIAALSLVPLIEVAWADGKMEPKEREAILKAAESQGLSKIEAITSLLQNWLDEQPGPQLSAAWREYVGTLCTHLDPRAREALKTDVMAQSRKVAESAGGILGIGSISSAEKAKLAELEAAFE
ncbi:MAG: hypothetical protein RIC55_29575 [Pirellulaceae bacterium]